MPKKSKKKKPELNEFQGTARKRNRELYSSSIKTGTSGTKPVPGYNSVFAKAVRTGKKIQKQKRK